jgi:Secretion system C-terminal sorting domain
MGTGGNKQWSNANNWMPNSVPSSLDDVEINISDSLDINQAVNIKSLHIGANIQVILCCQASRTLSISSSSTSNLGLLINANSTLYIEGNIPSTTTVSLVLDLTNNTGVTGEIYGTLIFRKTGGGTGSSNTKLETFAGALSYAKLVVKSGGVIRYEPVTSNTSSAGTPINSLTMENGSIYENAKNGGSFPNGLWYPNSLCLVTGSNPIGPTFSGTIYGNLKWNTPLLSTSYNFNANLTFNKVIIENTNNTNVNVKGGTSNTTYTLTINDSLKIFAGQKLNTTSPTAISGTGLGNIIVKGHVENNGTITKSGTVANADTLEFAGTINQNYNGTGSITNELIIKINNAAGVTLNSPLVLPNKLRLENGLINTTATKLLTLTATNTLNPIISNNGSQYSEYVTASSQSNFGNESSYINGPLNIITTGGPLTNAVAYPIGNNTYFRPFFISNQVGEMVGEYKQINPWTLGTALAAGLDHTSSVEYWNITSAAGSGNVELTFYDVSGSQVTNMADLRVAHWNGTLWENLGNTNTFGTAGSSGSVTSINTSVFSPFTLASSTSQNPLPLKDIKLTLLQNNYENILKWTVIGEENVEKYCIQKSIDKINIENVFTQNAYKINTIANYTYKDVIGNFKYRIKAVLTTGEIAYSNWVNSYHKNKIEMYPNPTTDYIKLNTKTPSIINMYNTIGKLVYTQKINSTGNFNINVKHLINGIYTIKLIDTKSEMISTSIFIKN